MIIHDMDEREYHGDHTRDSHSAVEAFLRRRSDYPLFKAGKLNRKPTEEMSFGRYFHALALEGREAVADRYLVGPSRLDVGQAKAGDADANTVCNRTKKDGRDAWESFMGECAARKLEPVLPNHHACAAAMLEALAGHHEAADLLFPVGAGVNESVIHWDEPTTGRPCRTRLDRRLDARLLAPDLKTYRPEPESRRPDPDRVAQTAYRFGYHRQAAMYLDALLVATGERYAMPFVFVSVEDEPKVWVWWAEHDSIAVRIGRREYQAAMAEIVACEKSGVWRQTFELASNQPFELPGYVLRQYEFGDETDDDNQLVGVEPAP